MSNRSTSAGEVEAVSGIVLFAFKNLLVIPVATIHLLWALRLLRLGRPRTAMATKAREARSS